MLQQCIKYCYREGMNEYLCVCVYLFVVVVVVPLYGPDGVVVQDVLCNGSFEIARLRKWEHLVGSDILRVFSCWQIPVPLLIEEPTAKYLPIHYYRLLTTCVHV